MAASTRRLAVGAAPAVAGLVPSVPVSALAGMSGKRLPPYL
ncbi:MULTISPECIES: hypothetical protein [unclassified Streptomyces]